MSTRIYGPGLSLRSISRRLYQQPERYGAIGDGIANDGPAVRLCMLACLTAGVAMELTRGKTYLCTTWTAVDTILPLLIHGNDATLKGPAVRADFARPGSPIVICTDVRFERWLSIFERQTAETGSIGELKFIGNTCTDISSIVLHFERPIESYRIVGNRFSNTDGGYVIRIGFNDGSLQDTWQDGWICGNQFKDVQGSTSTAAAIVYGRKVKICDNLVEDVYCSGAEEAWGFYTKCRYTQVCRNTIRNVTALSHADIIGINLKGLDRGAPTLPQGFDCVCTDNILETIGTPQVCGVCIRGQSDDVIIANNICDDGGIIGITIDEATGTVNSLVCNNRIYFADPVGTTGIYYGAGGWGHVCSNNIIRGSTIGIRLQAGASATGSEYQVLHNLIEAATAAIATNSVSAMDHVRIIGNTLTAGARGWLNDNGGGALTAWEFEGNDFSVATTAKFAGLMPTSVRLVGNKGYMEASEVYNPGNLNAGIGVTESFACIGALPGDFCYAAFSAMAHGITLDAYCVTANTISVRFQNVSAGALDLASGTLSAYAERR